MRWQIPAKTFLLGEYAALADHGSIILTTFPCFEVELSLNKAMQGIHPQSPAGRWWALQSNNYGLNWYDPYLNKGGLGASSAQFLGAYLASCFLQKTFPTHQQLLETYFKFSWLGKGLRPSGYDVLAQSLNQCVYINRRENHIECYEWGFEDIGFLLLHTGNKLATHTHLESATLPTTSMDYLAALVKEAQMALQTKNSVKMIDSINHYQQELGRAHLIAPFTLQKIEELKYNSSLLAIKGCGAMGADVLLVLLLKAEMETKERQLTAEGWHVLASSEKLHQNMPLL